MMYHFVAIMDNGNAGDIYHADGGRGTHNMWWC